MYKVFNITFLLLCNKSCQLAYTKEQHCMKSYVFEQHFIHDVTASMKSDLVHGLKSEIGKAHLNNVSSVPSEYMTQC